MAFLVMSLIKLFTDRKIKANKEFFSAFTEKNSEKRLHFFKGIHIIATR